MNWFAADTKSRSQFPDLVDFAQAAGLSTVPFGLDTRTWLDLYRNLWTSLLGRFWRVRELRRLWREMWELSDQNWMDISTTLMSLVGGGRCALHRAKLRGSAANVAEYFDVPFVTLHHAPQRANSKTVSILPTHGPTVDGHVRLAGFGV